MKIKNIQDICEFLNEQLSLNNSLDVSDENNNDSINEFVESAMQEFGIKSHTISPLRWSFESNEHGIFDDGVVEAKKISDETVKFSYVNLSEAKIT